MYSFGRENLRKQPSFFAPGPSGVRETFPYGLSQTVLQTLLGANVGALLKTKIGHQNVSDRQRSFLMAKFRIGQKADRNFDAKTVARGNAQSPGSWCYASLNSLQPPGSLIVFLSLKYRLCSKVILRRCMCRPLKRRAILPPHRLLFFSRQSAAVRQMILRRSMFRHLKKTAIFAKQRKLQK